MRVHLRRRAVETTQQPLSNREGSGLEGSLLLVAALDEQPREQLIDRDEVVCQRKGSTGRQIALQALLAQRCRSRREVLPRGNGLESFAVERLLAGHQDVRIPVERQESVTTSEHVDVREYDT